MDIKQTAYFWLSEGVSTIPLVYRSKKPIVKWTQYKTRLPSPMEIEEWYSDCRHNIAIVTGWSGLCILDFDSPENLSCWYVWQLIYNPKILETYRTITSRGLHYYYYLSDPAHLDSIQGALFEVKTAGKLCTCPPSVHESGRAYQPLSDPAQIRTVKAEEILNYSPVALRASVWLPRSKFAPVDTDKSSIKAIKESVSLLAFFPTARKLDDHRYLADCPLHGHRANFWLDTSLGVCGCFAGCNGGRAMNVIQLFAAMNNCDVKTAIRELVRMIGG